MKCALLLTLIIFIISCNGRFSTKENDEATDTITDYDTSAVNPAEKTSTCYESINGRDTVYLSLFSASEVITGSLQYRYYEKDKNSGSVNGMMRGDTLFAEYIFMSEGKASLREVAFLKQGNSFTEGYGDMKQVRGRMTFKNTNELSFTGNPLQMVNCTNE